MAHRSAESGLKLAGILFLDIKGFSTLSQAQLERYIGVVLPELANEIEPYRSTLLELNTWGDGLVAVSDNPVALARLALAFRDYFRRTNFEEKALPTSLQPRISVHAGTVYFGHDPIRKTRGVIGTNVNLAARVEPVIIPGEVWATDDFAQMMTIHAKAERLAFDDLGPRQLAKGYGSRRLLRLRRADEHSGLSPTIESAIKSETKIAELHTPYDVIAIGAMNTDFIATATALKKLKPDLLAEHEQLFEFGKERPAGAEEVKNVIQKIGTSVLTPALGGSSFNTIHALAMAVPEFRLGFVGVAGKSVAAPGFRQLLEGVGVDCHLVKESDQDSGVCVSYIKRGEHVLF